MDREEIKKEVFKKQPKLRKRVIKDLKKYLILNKNYKLDFNPRIKRLKDYRGYKVFVVDGNLIRDKLDIDFVMGGNGYRYLYIPIDEIWVEDIYEKSDGEVKPIIIHEYAELKLMKKGMIYGKAHDLANVEELISRRNKNL